MADQADTHGLSGSKRNVGLVELPDEALDVFSHYTQLPDWDVTLVVSQVHDSYAVRMAEILQIPVLDVANRLSLLSCDRVIVGNRPASLLATIREMLEETSVEVTPLEDVLQKLGISGIAPPDQEPSADAFLDINPLDDGMWTGPERERETWPVLTDVVRHSSRGEERLLEPADTEPPAEASPPAEPEPRPETSPPVESGPCRPEAILADPGPEAAPPVDAAVAPEEVPAGFDPGTLLGGDLGERLGAIALDARSDQMLSDILRLAVRATHAQSGSLMLLDEDGVHLRIAVAEGLPPEIVASTRRKIGEGIAGRVFASAKPQLVRGRMNGAEELRSRPALREAACVPVLSEGAPIGVLNVNVESESVTLDEKSLALLTRFAKEASAAVLKAVDLRRLEISQKRAALLRQTDRLLALQESLPVRLRSVGDAVANAVDADFMHFFVVDPLGRRLELMTPPRGVATWHPRSQPLDKGFLGWSVRQGEPRVLEVTEADGDRRAAMVCLPIVGSHPHALIVLENVRLGEDGADATVALLKEVAVHLGRMVRVEEGVDAQELLYQLKMRVADQVPQLAALPPVQRTRSALDLAVSLLAGEVAVWVPPHNARPVTSEPHSERAVQILTQVRSSLDLLAEWVRDRGAVAGGASDPGWDPKSPKGPAPYVGVASSDGEGVLLLFFAPGEATGSPAQVPAQVLLETVLRIAELCSPSLDPAKAPRLESQMAVPRTHEVAGGRELEALVHQEWLRSRRYGHAFGLTRFQLAPEAVEVPDGTLREFILSTKRDVDLMGEIRPGVFVVLSPEVDRNPEGLPARLTDAWRRRHPDARLMLEQKVFPRDGHVETVFQSWLAKGGPRDKAA